jgi:hypothetical protein
VAGLQVELLVSVERNFAEQVLLAKGAAAAVVETFQFRKSL